VLYIIHIMTSRWLGAAIQINFSQLLISATLLVSTAVTFGIANVERYEHIATIHVDSLQALILTLAVCLDILSYYLYWLIPSRFHIALLQ